MRKTGKKNGFRIRQIKTKDHGFSYSTFQVVGYLNGERVRKKFKSREDALGELNRLQVAAANRAGDIRAVNTRLTGDQIAAAEAAFNRLGDTSLALAVDWYFKTYRAPLVDMGMEQAMAEFMRHREAVVSISVVKDYRRLLGLLKRTFSGRTVGSISTRELEEMLRVHSPTKKTWNNLRTYLAAFFEFCRNDARRWVDLNPVAAIIKYEIARGIPRILKIGQAVELFKFLETYSGPPRSGNPPGYLVPYFALATFAGIRPYVDSGELLKIHRLADKSQVIDTAVGVIRITPEVAKTNDLRQTTIQPNLAAWLKKYPIAEFPLMVPNMGDHVGLVKKRFAIGADVLRHTFISMHVAKFQSLGSAALEAGNSEAVIKKHYLNLVTPADAEAFWGIVPVVLATA